jgi:tetratricopeptide (TPR) repeat protein
MNWDRYNEVVALRNSGRIQEATTELSRIADAEVSLPIKAIVLLEVANSFILLKRFSDARLKINEATIILAVNHELYPRALLANALLDMEQTQWKEALEKLDRIIEEYFTALQVDDNRDVLEEVQRNRGIALFELNRLHEAIPQLEGIRSIDYKKDRTLYSLAMAHFELGSFDEAKRDFEELLSLNPNSIYQSHAHYHLGRLLYDREQYARAKTEFEKSLACPDKGGISDHSILEGLIYSCKALNLDEDAARYMKMLKSAGGGKRAGRVEPGKTSRFPDA